MKKRGFLNLCVVAAALSVTAGTLYSCKDYDDEIYAELNGLHGQNSTLGGQIALQEQQLNDLRNQLNQAVTDANNSFATKEMLQNSIATIEKTLNEKEENLLKRIVALETARAEIEAQLKTIGLDIESLKAEDKVLHGRIDAVVQDIANNKAAIEANAALIAANKKEADANKQEVDEKIAAVDAEVKKNKENIAAQEKTLNTILEQMTQVQAGINTKIADLQKQINEQTAKHDADIKALQDRVGALEPQVKKNTEELAALGLKLDALQQKVDNMITSVVLNGAYSPVVGYFALPTGLKSNILAAYYGSVETNDPRGLVFPAKKLSTFAGAPVKGGEFTQPSGTPMVAAGNNAGKVYLTVNPSSVDMAGKEFSLVNSLGEVAPMTFGQAVPSKDKLAFGYTRAVNNTNFYEVPASLGVEQIEQAKLRVEIEDLKAAIGEVKTAIQNKSGLDVTNLASTLFACINDLADAQAVKATWFTKDAQGVSVKHDVMSDFGLAAVAVKPLSFTFAEGMERTSFPGVDKAYEFVDKLVGKLRGFADDVKPNFNFEMDDLNIGEIKLKDLSEELLAQFILEVSSKISFDLDQATYGDKYTISADGKTVTITADIDGMDVINAGAPIIGGSPATSKVTIKKQTIAVDDEHVIVHIDGSVEFVNAMVRTSATVTVDMRDAIKDFYESVGQDIEGQFSTIKSNLEEYVKQIDQLMADLKDYQNKVNSKVDDSINEIESKLNGFITKVNGKLCQIVNNFNAALQPVMFAQGIGDFVMISGAQSAPSLFPSSFVLVPSSYTGEYLAPAAQKYVAVTNVFKGGKSAQEGDAQCKSALKDANEKNADLNKVLEGANHAVKVENLKSGYTYEFTYSAVDFYGKVADTKCYVTVK